MSTDRYIALDATTGSLKEVPTIDSTTGVADAGKIPALDNTGRLALNMMPEGLGPEVWNLMASEALVAGDIVNVYDASGTPKARKSNATTNGKPANGFVKAGVSLGDMVDVYFYSNNDVLTTLTPGARYFLSTTAGTITTTPPATAGNVVQFVGVAVNSTTLAFRPGELIVRA